MSASTPVRSATTAKPSHTKTSGRSAAVAPVEHEMMSEAAYQTYLRERAFANLRPFSEAQIKALCNL